jgi:hypothetical protein
MPRRPFSMLRGCFFLLGAIILAQVVTIMAGAATCYALLLTGQAQVGSCTGFGQQARDMWAEALAAVLALLLAARPPSPPDPPPPPPPARP